jgi:hypothetical protein
VHTCKREREREREMSVFTDAAGGAYAVLGSAVVCPSEEAFCTCSIHELC